MAIQQVTAIAVQPTSRLLTTLDAALNAVAHATTSDEIIEIANRAEALRVYAKAAKIGLTVQNRAAAVRLYAERRLGEYLVQTQRHVGGRPRVKPVPGENGFSPPRLRELGIDRKLSFRAQRLAAIPTSNFDAWLERAQLRQQEITTRDLLNQWDRKQAATRNRQRIVGGRVNDLIRFARSHKVGTILLDPPWPVEGALLPYEAISLDDLGKLPIPALAAERCHIHCWATGVRNLIAANEIIESWGFRLVADFCWVKPSLGGRNYWRQSHETLLTAVRAGVDDRFDDHSLRSWIEAPRGRHSEKPEVVREMIERASPGPRLELFARKLTRGWYAWGHEVSEPLDGQQSTIDCVSIARHRFKPNQRRTE